MTDRYSQCHGDCTTDCGHCKGKGRPAPDLSPAEAKIVARFDAAPTLPEAYRPLAVIERPNGKTYRAKKPPVALLLTDGDDFPTGVMVERTHDVERAKQLALGVARNFDCEEWPMSEPELCWVRSRPDGPERFAYDNDDERGCPAVQFRLTEPKWEASR